MAIRTIQKVLPLWALWITAAFFLLSSCITQKKLEYVRGPEQEMVLYGEAPSESNRIKEGDELYIRVSSFDDVAFNFFNNQSDNRQMSLGNEISVSMISYTVNDSGAIIFPTLGKVFLEGLTVEEAIQHMESLLSDFFNQPTVLMKIVNKSISVLGEVRSPGRYLYTKSRLNILEALGLAGDVTVHGIKQEVVLIRETEKGTEKVTLDLTDDMLFTNPYYYIQSNDVIFVKPRYSSRWSLTASMYSLLLSSITTFILILNYISNN